MEGEKRDPRPDVQNEVERVLERLKAELEQAEKISNNAERIEEIKEIAKELVDFSKTVSKMIGSKEKIKTKTIKKIAELQLKVTSIIEGSEKEEVVE